MSQTRWEKTYGHHLSVALGTPLFWLTQRNERSVMKIVISFKILCQFLNLSDMLFLDVYLADQMLSKWCQPSATVGRVCMWI